MAYLAVRPHSRLSSVTSRQITLTRIPWRVYDCCQIREQKSLMEVPEMVAALPILAQRLARDNLWPVVLFLLALAIVAGFRALGNRLTERRKTRHHLHELQRRPPPSRSSASLLCRDTVVAYPAVRPHSRLSPTSNHFAANRLDGNPAARV